MKFLFLVVALSFGLTACDKKSSPDGTVKRARAEEEAGNENLARKARLMEEDLRRRYNFYSGISFTYWSTFKINENTYRAKFIFAPTRHIVDAGRTRTLEEIQDDLDNLFVNAKVGIWDSDGVVITPDCTFTNIRPDLVTGKIEMLVGNCPLSFTVRLTTAATAPEDRTEVARQLADALRSGELAQIDFLHAVSSSTFNPNGYDFLLERTND